MKRYLMTYIGVLSGIIVGIIIGYFLPKGNPEGVVKERVKTIRDTIVCNAPKAESELVVGTGRYSLPISSTRDFSQKHLMLHPEDSVSDKPAATYGGGAGGEPRCCADSMTAELPMLQRHYADSTYEAWVSGPLDPRLDSINVFRETTMVTREVWKPPKRWHIGPTIGYGITPHGFQPYAGISITYSVIQF